MTWTAGTDGGPVGGSQRSKLGVFAFSLLIARSQNSARPRPVSDPVLLQEGHVLPWVGSYPCLKMRSGSPPDVAGDLFFSPGRPVPEESIRNFSGIVTVVPWPFHSYVIIPPTMVGPEVIPILVLSAHVKDLFALKRVILALFWLTVSTTRHEQSQPTHTASSCTFQGMNPTQTHHHQCTLYPPRSQFVLSFCDLSGIQHLLM